MSESLALLRDELRSLFRDLDESMLSSGGSKAGPAAGPPAVDAIQTPAGVEIRIDLLATAPSTLSVEVDGDDLIIRGSRRIETEEQAGHARQADQRVRHFARRIQIPRDLVPRDLEASYAHGLLEIRLLRDAPAARD